MKSLTPLRAPLVVAFTAAVVLGPLSASTPLFSVTDLGTLGGSSSHSLDINNAGQVTGWAYLPGDTVRHAVRWTSGSAEDLGSLGTASTTSFGSGINSSGQVTGFSYLSGTSFPGRGVRWTGSTASDLITGSLGSYYSNGEGINDAGHVAGWAYDGTGASPYYAVRWTESGIENLGTLGGSRSRALDINNSDQVTGWSYTGTGTHAVRWTGSTAQDLGTLGVDSASGLAINDSGHVVGWSYVNQHYYHATIWLDTDAVDLGTLGGSQSLATDINSSGDIVGWSYPAGGSTPAAFLYTDGTMHNLLGLLSPGSGVSDLGVASGGDGTSINDLGQIAVSGVINGETHALLLTPIPTPPLISSLNPADNAIDVPVGASLAVTFNEGVQAGTGNIVLYDAADSLVQTFDVTTQASFNGSTVTVTPSSDLTNSAGYYIQVDATAITDNATVPNAFAGIADKTTWNFTVVDATFSLTLDSSASLHGNVSGGGAYLSGTSAALTATPNPGYVFIAWTGDAPGTNNPLEIVMDSNKTIGASFEQDLADPDNDDLTNYEELAIYGTNPDLADTDGDGLLDGPEVNTHGSSPLLVDTDEDGLNDLQEVNQYGTDPLIADTDEDGLNDGVEVNTTLSDPTLDDTDGDGLLDGPEVNTHGSSPLLVDTDEDGLNDRVEVEVYGSNPTLKDTDSDGFDDGFEVSLGTNPVDDDSDDDTFLDGNDTFPLDPNEWLDTDGDSIGNNADSDDDSDGLSDDQEAAIGTNPLLVDTDGDGLTDYEEFLLTTNPLLTDTDGDGLSDYEELFVYETSGTNADTDGDLLPDGLEVLTLATDPNLYDSDGDGTSDADEDMDGDGWTTFEEIDLFLTDPLDGKSSFAPRLIVSGQTHSLIFPTILGRSYRVDRTSTIQSSWSEWTTVEDLEQEVTVPLGPISGAFRFYRVTVWKTVEP